jgi:DNA-binding transcriptional LysR family regulator
MSRIPAMEMHQIRYFLAVARELNFTRAAESCNVSQPALTRAIQQLEDELGGQLLRREGKLSHLTDLGERMLPLMVRCRESALAAKSLASSFKIGSAQVLLLALARTIEVGPATDCLTQIQHRCSSLQFKILRGSAVEISEHLKRGQAELAIAGPIEQAWDRLDHHPLYEEELALAIAPQHRFAGRNQATIEDLAGERILLDTACEMAAGLAEQLQRSGLSEDRLLRIGSRQDILALIEANLGVGFLPASVPARLGLRLVRVDGLDTRRQISLYTVAGRQRSAAADAMIKLLRARDWSVKPG